jgi:hypothetical protein
VKAYDVRCFCLASQNLLATAMADRFLDNPMRSRRPVPSVAPSSTPSTATASSASRSATVRGGLLRTRPTIDELRSRRYAPRSAAGILEMVDTRERYAWKFDRQQWL